ncbi:hypothetical protein [Spiroplasma endosymbiont of Dasysyrphus albostriatus]|uniref:hypothetical protein n=1 Tax=Spiroplasma endosymbiont of Dasysyrphus albostriatus TaxID=3066299 RepID=UPI0030CB9A6D
MNTFIEKEKIKVLNEFLNLSLIKIARKYLKLLKNNRKINTNEIILDVLDISVYLSEKDININDKNFLKKFKNPSKKEQNKIIKALKNPNNDKIYKDLAIELGIIFLVIKDKVIQDKLFNCLFKLYIENNENINIFFKVKKEDNFYNEFKSDFINNINNNKFIFCLPS